MMKMGLSTQPCRTDKDKTFGGTGSNWINARANTAWTNQGGDYLTASAYSSYNYTQILQLNRNPIIWQKSYNYSGILQIYGDPTIIETS